MPVQLQKRGKNTSKGGPWGKRGSGKRVKRIRWEKRIATTAGGKKDIAFEGKGEGGILTTVSLKSRGRKDQHLKRLEKKLGRALEKVITPQPSNK